MRASTVTRMIRKLEVTRVVNKIVAYPPGVHIAINVSTCSAPQSPAFGSTNCCAFTCLEAEY
jgi:hypothetical protein